MSQPVLRPSPPVSSSSSRSRQRRSRFQLLHQLPASVLAAVCPFLTVYQVMSLLRRTCRAMHGSVRAECLLHSRLVISSDSLLDLVEARPSTRALISRVQSLSIVYRYEEGDDGLQNAMPLHELRSPHDASRFLFSSLTSLHVAFDCSQLACPQPVIESCLLSVLLLLAGSPDSFFSLRSLHIDGRDYVVAGDIDLALCAADVNLPFWSLARLPQLTHCRVELSLAAPLLCSSLVSALTCSL